MKVAATSSAEAEVIAAVESVKTASCLSRLKRLWRREIASRGEEKSSSHHEFFIPWNELFSSNL